MKILICLAMSCGLTAILYFYLKQRLSVIENRLNTLTDLAQTLATELYQKEKQQLTHPVLNEVSDESDDSDSDSEDETDDETVDSSIDEYEVIDDVPMKEINLEQPEIKQIPLVEPIIEIEVDPIIVYKVESKVEANEKANEKANVEANEKTNEKAKVEAKEVLIEVSDDESTVKQVTVDNEFSQLSLKDLKQKVNDLGGPPLKTKQALINFLKKKV